MTNKIALVPVDARPVTYDMPVALGDIAEWNVLVPDKEILGYLKQPADLDKLFEWLNTVASEVSGIVASLDMVLYGGLVPSRINTDDAATIKKRLNKFLELKNKNPDLKLMLFSSTMRISNNYVNIEEKEYWSEYGEEIWALSYYSHRYEQLQNPEDLARSKKAEEKIPSAIRNDYLETRERNFQINLSLFELLEPYNIDLLVFPQDDTSEFGYNIKEQQQLKEIIRQKNLYDQVLIYPGADEVASLLIARMIYTLEDKSFPTFYPVYSGHKGMSIVARYEDRTIDESVKGQVFALGSHMVESVQEADVLLGVNVPGEQQGEIALQQSLNQVDTNNRNVGEWIRKLHYYSQLGKEIAIIDVAYANGADVAMMPQLLKKFTLSDLVGFAAWNTAGNTIGTVVAQAALILLAKEKGLSITEKKEKLLLLRVLDDYIYQSQVRQTVRQAIQEEKLSKTELLETVAKHFYPTAQQFIESLQVNTKLDAIYLPWDRTFEIGIRLK